MFHYAIFVKLYVTVIGCCWFALNGSLTTDLVGATLVITRVAFARVISFKVHAHGRLFVTAVGVGSTFVHVCDP